MVAKSSLLHADGSSSQIRCLMRIETRSKIQRRQTEERKILMIREARQEDLDQILKLYLDLHEKEIPVKDARLENIWKSILSDRNHHLIVAKKDGKIISSCDCIIVMNLTRNLHPYALIENVVTSKSYRKQGYASECLAYAVNLARTEGCYKIMLLTGSKDQETLNFYQHAGFSSTDKTAFVQWIG